MYIPGTGVLFTLSGIKFRALQSSMSSTKSDALPLTPGIVDALSDAPPATAEEDVLRLVAQGFSNKQIAGQLEVSVKSVETYKARASEKKGLFSRADIVRFGIKQGWLTAPN